MGAPTAPVGRCRLPAVLSVPSSRRSVPALRPNPPLRPAASAATTGRSSGPRYSGPAGLEESPDGSAVSPAHIWSTSGPARPLASGSRDQTVAQRSRRPGTEPPENPPQRCRGHVWGKRHPTPAPSMRFRSWECGYHAESSTLERLTLKSVQISALHARRDGTALGPGGLVTATRTRTGGTRTHLAGAVSRSTLTS